MRPVERGAAPKVYTKYQDAGPDLQERLGDYCSYCERRIETNLAVEHIQPKDLNPALRNTWANFLLGCVNCNSSKGSQPVLVPEYLWPDLDNTLMAFDYSQGGLVTSSLHLSAAIRPKADALIQLAGLDKDPGNPIVGRQPTEADKRWLKRKEAWQQALRCKEILDLQDTPETRELIVEVALGRGMFSIYWKQFSHDADMRKRLREAFLGTAFNCFDPQEDLLSRPGGQI